MRLLILVVFLPAVALASLGWPHEEYGGNFGAANDFWKTHKSSAPCGYSGHSHHGSSSSSSSSESGSKECGCRHAPNFLGLHSSSCSTEQVVRHKPRVLVRHRRIVVNHPQRINRLVRTVTLNKHVVHRLPEMYNKVHVSEKWLRPRYTKASCHHAGSSLEHFGSSSEEEFANNDICDRCGRSTSTSRRRLPEYRETCGHAHRPACGCAAAGDASQIAYLAYPWVYPGYGAGWGYGKGGYAAGYGTAGYGEGYDASGYGAAGYGVAGYGEGHGVSPLWGYGGEQVYGHGYGQGWNYGTASEAGYPAGYSGYNGYGWGGAYWIPVYIPYYGYGTWTC